MEAKGLLNTGNEKIVTKRKEILEKKKAIEEIIKAASSSDNDHLASFPHFRHYSRDGLFVYLESGHGDKLSSPLKRYIKNLLKANMEGLYGSGWPAEEKVKRWEMVSPEAHYIFVHEVSKANNDQMSPVVEGKRIFTNCVDDRGPIVGFVQYRFTIEEEIPVLYVYELQLQPHVQAKGIGKFLMQLLELIALKDLKMKKAIGSGCERNGLFLESW